MRTNKPLNKSNQCNSSARDTVFWQPSALRPANREALNGHSGTVLWFTGLSGSGKSTLAHAVEWELHRLRCHTYVLDGDNIRHGLCADLDFSKRSRQENIRRVGEVSKLFVDSGMIVLAALISPFRDDRRKIRELNGERFIEVFCDCPVEVCEKRDVKGLYRKARIGQIQNFTGISSRYEAPEAPELAIKTAEITINNSVATVLAYLRARSIIPAA